MKNRPNRRKTARLILCGLAGFFAAVLLFTVAVNLTVEKSAEGRIYSAIDSIPRNRVALLLGTNPLNRYGRPNSYFTNRINTAAELYHAGKADFIIASGDNHTHLYDEPTAMRDSLMARGVPEDRIIPDYAGFRTLDSVVRAKEVFGCDSLTIVSQADHCARALYLAGHAGIKAVALAAPLRAGRCVRTRLALREWLARDKMMLDIWLKKQPHFLGERIKIPDAPQSHSTRKGISLTILNPDSLRMPVDSIAMRFTNSTDTEALFGEDYTIESDTDGAWQPLRFNPEYYADGTLVRIIPAIGYILEPKSQRDFTINTKEYNKTLTKGKYRISKTFTISDTHHQDTAYVEFRVP